MTVEAHLQVKHHLDCLYNSSIEEGIKSALVYIKNLNLDTLTPALRIRVLYKELEHVTKQINDQNIKDYFQFASNKVFTYKIYVSRLLFYNLKEDEMLRKTFIWFERKKLLDELFQKEMEQLHALTYERFLQNEDHFVFYELDQKPWGTPGIVFERIKSWQNKRKIQCVQAEANAFRERFIARTSVDKNRKYSIIAELKQLECIFNGKTLMTAEQLAMELLKLKALTIQNMPIDIDSLYQQFKRCNKGEHMNQGLNPKFFDTTMERISDGVLSEPPVFCWSLNSYWKWLTDLAQQKTTIQAKIHLCFEQMCDDTFEKGIKRSTLAVDKLRSIIAARRMTDEEHLAFVRNEINRQWKNYKKLSFPDYFNLLLVRQALKNCFVNNCLANVHNELHQDELMKIVVLCDTVDFLNRELILLGHKPDRQTARKLFDSYQITELIGCMAPTSGAINQMLEAVKRIMVQLENEIMPACLITEEIKTSFAGLYETAEEEMKLLFENQTDQAIGLFASCQIREINYLKSKCERNGLALHNYFMVLKKFFKDELHNIKDIQTLKTMDSKPEVRDNKKKYYKKKNFGYIKTSTGLIDIIYALCIRINLLDPRTTIDEFIRIITCDDLTLIKEKIYLGCQTNEFKYVINWLKIYFKNLRPAAIGQSGIFISVHGNPVSATNLGSSAISNLATKYAIDNIFSKKH